VGNSSSSESMKSSSEGAILVGGRRECGDFESGKELGGAKKKSESGGMGKRA